MKIQRKTARAEVPSLAMGDIAFNLLIFFVILARAQDDSYLNWQPAAAKDLENAGHAKVSVVIDTDITVVIVATFSEFKNHVVKGNTSLPKSSR